MDNNSEESVLVVIDHEWRKMELRSLLIPSMRCNSSAVLVGNNLWLIGGRGVGQFNEVWCFSLQERMWEHVHLQGEGPSPRDGHSATKIMGNEIILFGGQGLCKLNDADRVDRVSDNQKIKALTQREVHNDMFLFECDSRKWTHLIRKSRCPAGRRGHSAIFLQPEPPTIRMPSRHHKSKVNFTSVEGYPDPSTKGLLLVYGGAYMEAGWGLEQISNELWIYNIETGVWTHQRPRGAHPPPMYEHAAALVSEQMVISGGIVAPHRIDPEELTNKKGDIFISDDYNLIFIIFILY